MAEGNLHRRGFGSLTPEQRREYAARGGRKAQARGTAHRWTSETAKEANRRAIESRRASKTPEPTE